MRSRKYQRLLNSKRWKELRAWKLRQQPLCERCLAEGKLVPAVDVHHIVEVESATSDREMESLCLGQPQNLQSLCIPCHIAVHKARGRGKNATHQQREKERLAQWASRHTPGG